MKITEANILVVDDDPVMLMYVLNLLTRLDAGNVARAGDGPTALTLAQSFRPDAVLTDFHMAPMNGIELVRQLRLLTDPNLRKVPVVLMSADQNALQPSDSIRLGIAGCLAKPPTQLALHAKLEQVLKLRSR